MIDTVNAATLARAFSRLLTRELSAAELEEVRERNLLPEYAESCASNDFLDANVVMAQAWAEVHGRGDVLMHFPTMNEAWDIARAHGFNADAIDDAN